MKGFKFIFVKDLNKIINYLLIDRNVFEIDVTIRYLIANLIMLNVNMLNSIVMLRILD